MPLITVDGLKPDGFAALSDDAPLPEAGGAIVSLERFLRDRDALVARNAPIGVLLRTRLHFTGEIRAVGDFLYDQIAYQRRVGFDSWEVPEGLTAGTLRQALLEMTDVYQPSADGRRTIAALRGDRGA
jgi:uncharacterized protein (DUF934 family)